MFCWYSKRLDVFVPKCGYYIGKWEILGIVDEGLNNETIILLQYWDLHRRNVDEAWCLLEWVAWDSLSLKRLVAFMDFYFMTHVHFMLDSTKLLFGVIFVILLPIMLVHVLIMHIVLLLICLYL